MATAQPTNACSLCMENYIDPRKLPNCAHTFCRACLITYISKFQDNKELQNGIPCPLCRIISPTSQDFDKPAEWVNSLEKVTTKFERYEKTQQEPICASCHAQGKSSKPAMYCFNCLEKLCEACMISRHTYVRIKDHQYVNVSESFGENGEDETLRTFSEYISCSCHPDRPVGFLCEDDKEFCCSTCIVVKHRKCGIVLELEELSNQNDAKAEKDHIIELINKLESYANDSIEKMKACISENKNQVESMIERLKRIREQINKLLDTFENNCIDLSKAAAKKETLEISDGIDKLKIATDTIRRYKNMTQTVDKYGSLGHQYVSAKRLKADVHEVELSISDTTSLFRGLSISLIHNSLLTDILKLGPNDTDKLASITESRMESLLPTYDSDILLKNYKITKKAEVVVQENQSKSSPSYSSLAFLPNNNFVLVDTRTDVGQCLLATQEGKVVTSFDFRSCGAGSFKKPYCATVTKTGMVAVSLPGLKKIAVICPDDQMKILHSMDTKYKPRAICGLKNGDLAVAWSDPVAFGIISIDEVPVEKVYFCQDKSGRELKNFDYIAVDERRSHVIQPCRHGNVVYCFDLEGSSKFQYTNTELKFPYGVALDRDGNIYVCDYSAEAIHVISATGEGIRVFREGCPSHPAAIAFKKDGEEFAVTKCGEERRTVTFFRLQKS